MQRIWWRFFSRTYRVETATPPRPIQSDSQLECFLYNTKSTTKERPLVIYTFAGAATECTDAPLELLAERFMH